MLVEDSQENIERLRELVDRHRVCYEVWPEYLVLNERTKVGFLLELNGVHGEGVDHIVPGCKHCHDTFDDLRQIAEWITPKADRASYYDIQPFDNALREAPRRRFRQEVVLGIKILHRQGFDQPVDECEEMCLKEMRQKLAELGIHEGEWTSARGNSRTGITERVVKRNERRTNLRNTK
jgi:hypothetical protein